MINICIFGIGNIGGALCDGLSILEKDISISIHGRNKTEVNGKGIEKYKSFRVFKVGIDAIENSDIIFLCVRTNQVVEWIKEYRNSLHNKTIVLVQSGIYLRNIEDINLPKTTDVIRLITNVNVSKCLGHTVILNSNCDKFGSVKNIFSSLGEVLVVNTEGELDEVSLITGCTPAIGAMFLEGLSGGHDTNNIPLIADVVCNTIKVLKKSNTLPIDYVKKVYSKGSSFEKCVKGIGTGSDFQMTLKNWLNPLKSSLE